MSESNEFTINPDPILESWMDGMIRAQIATIEDVPGKLFCLGPIDDINNIIEYNTQKFCSMEVAVKTYVKKNLVAYCKNHLSILQEYLVHPKIWKNSE